MPHMRQLLITITVLFACGVHADYPPTAETGSETWADSETETSIPTDDGCDDHGGEEGGSGSSETGEGDSGTSAETSGGYEPTECEQDEIDCISDARDIYYSCLFGCDSDHTPGSDEYNACGDGCKADLEEAKALCQFC